MKPRKLVFQECRLEQEKPSRNWTGLCLMFTRSMYDVGPKYPSASVAWHNVKKKRRVEFGGEAPRGAPVWWTGGANGYGHVAISVGGGYCWSTDFARTGKVDLVRIDDITKAWNLNFEGWSEDLNGVDVWEKYEPPTPRVDRIVELAQEAKKIAKVRDKVEDLDEIIRIAKRWSRKY